jgi:hypothetical protein
VADIGSNPLTAEDAEVAEKKTAVNLSTLDGLETVGSIPFGAGRIPEPKQKRLCGLSVLCGSILANLA